MKRFRVLVLAAAAAVALTTLASPVDAITDGVIDGEGHPNVGVVFFYSPTSTTTIGRFRCTGTLVSPTVVLTAAHCTDGTVGRTIVSFDSVIAETAPSEVPAEAVVGSGYDNVGEFVDGRGRTWRSGTAHTSPDYSNFTDIANWNDYGVIVLDEPIEGITPAPLAPLNLLDTVAQPKLNKTIFTSVGYGTEVRKADGGPQKPTPMSFPLIRRVAQEPGQKLTTQILQVNGNGNDNRGTGGTCFGDSGGPTFLGSYLVTVTSYGYTLNCRYLDGLQRVDIEIAQDWLATFGVPVG